MSEITYSSTWSEAQVLLLENSAFKNDVSLLGMDKEDALIGMYLSHHLQNCKTWHPTHDQTILGPYCS